MPKPTRVVTTPELRCLRESEKAFLFDFGPGSAKEPFWIPKSQIEDPDLSEIRVGVECEITIPAWLADEKGLDE